MAKGQIPKHAFKKGQSGNPNGRPKLPGDLHLARALNSVELERILNDLLYNIEAADLDSVIQDPTRKPIEHVIARIVLEAIERGDAVRLDFLLNRIIGKVKEKVEIEVPKPTIIERLDGRIVELGVEKSGKNE